MFKKGSGFTLIELMIIVAITGILTAIAIPNFLKYQLRAKFGELPLNVNAIFKGEESFRQSDRTGPGGAAGQYLTVTQTPAACTPGTTKHPWNDRDYARGASIDWLVEGGTYGCYEALVRGGGMASGVSLTVAAWSDIDGDSVNGCVVLYAPQLDADGTPLVASPTPNGRCTGATLDAPWGSLQRPNENAF